MADRKVGEITVPTEPVSRATKITGFTFKSYDKNAGVLQFNIENQDGSPTDLIDATVRLFMYIYQGKEKKEFPIFDNQIITESYMQGIVKYRIPDMLLSYEGKVDANVYIDFPDGSHTDNLAFTFNIEKSIIDGDVQLNGEYYFKDFQQLLDGVKQEATDAVNAALTNVDSTIEKANQQINEFVQGATQAIDQTVDEVTEQLQATQTKIDTVSQNVTSAQNNLKAVEDKMNQTNQEIGALGKLKKMYSNSIDFGDYDYSGNPNLITNLSYSDISTSWTQEGSAPIPPSSDLVIDNGDSFTVDLSKFTGNLGLYFNNLPRPLVGKNYAWSIELKSEEPLAGNVFFVRPVYTNASGMLSAYAKPINTGATTEMTRYSTTYTNITDIISNSKCQSLQMYFPKELPRTKVTIKYNIKVEQVLSTSDTATAYQPNLLVEPYYLSKTALGKNIRRTDVGNSLPRTTTEYQCYVGNIEGYYEANQDYVITMKATKPATQTFGLYLLAGSQHAGNLMPVEGLTDTWQLNFRPTKEMIDAGVRNQINIFQVPQSTKGEVKIEWIKLEKGDTRTPNISQFKYFGEGLKDSNNPNDYSWDITPEYTEKGLNDSVSLTEPETVLGLKNFEDGLQVAGKEVATVPEDTGWVNLTAINGHSWNKQGQIRRIGKLVMFRGSLKGSTLSTQDFCTIPEGFRPSNPTDNYEYQFLLPPQSSNTLDNGGMAYIRPNGVCGLPSFRGTVNLFLAPIQYYID
ncbi:BppU family phage baseplate upper protein [Enterococcus faecium]|uniref:BppU family phage baseplate upper protein n=1 Tax=Enterococcus faecium TaxID=1352 RepID=UPI0020903B24|nr:BppU family phage baseplate upper protein [Enterococcus faecium]MCO5449602.1 BppU family phage baseplate upper protein [Enterococcus faecium]